MTVAQRNGIAKTPFSAWTRTNPRLHSYATGLAIYDFDWIVRKRWVEIGDQRRHDLQYVMCIEEKRGGERLMDSFQRDSIYILNQILTSVTTTLTEPTTFNVVSPTTREPLMVRYFGYHILRFEKSGPLDSEWIMWDGKAISLSQLERLLLFDLSPMTRQPYCDPLNSRDT